MRDEEGEERTTGAKRDVEGTSCCLLVLLFVWRTCERGEEGQIGTRRLRRPTPSKSGGDGQCASQNGEDEAFECRQRSGTAVKGLLLTANAIAGASKFEKSGPYSSKSVVFIFSSSSSSDVSGVPPSTDDVDPSSLTFLRSIGSDSSTCTVSESSNTDEENRSCALGETGGVSL